MSNFAPGMKATQTVRPGATVAVSSTRLGSATDRHPVLALQRAIGNQAVARLLRRKDEAAASGAAPTGVYAGIPGAIQTKLEVNQPGDEHEKEAEHVADHVMQQVGRKEEDGAVPGAQLQRKCADCEKEEGNKSGHAAQTLRQTLEGQDDDSPFTQRTFLRRTETPGPGGGGEVAPEVASQITQMEGGGDALPPQVQRSMEGSFGRDFSGVRIHRDAQAGEVSHQVSAQAFTHGNHIFFGHGKFDPEGSGGKRLLAHELTHVVQQGEAAPHGGERSGVAARSIQRVATWGAAGTVHQVNNLANVLVNGGPVGITFPTLNGAIVSSTASSRAALVSPTLVFTPVAAGGVDAKVNAVGTNTGSFDETVLAAGPWTAAASKAAIGGMFPGLAQCTGAGNSTFRAMGKPSDDHMFQANRRHENHHAADHQTVFNSTIKAWDTRLTAAKTAGTAFHGAAQADAEAAAFTAMGGTANQVADNYINGCFAAERLSTRHRRVDL